MIMNESPLGYVATTSFQLHHFQWRTMNGDNPKSPPSFLKLKQSVSLSVVIMERERDRGRGRKREREKDRGRDRGSGRKRRKSFLEERK